MHIFLPETIGFLELVYWTHFFPLVTAFVQFLQLLSEERRVRVLPTLVYLQGLYDGSKFDQLAGYGYKSKAHVLEIRNVEIISLFFEKVHHPVHVRVGPCKTQHFLQFREQINFSEEEAWVVAHLKHFYCSSQAVDFDLRRCFLGQISCDNSNIVEGHLPILSDIYMLRESISWRKGRSPC